MDLEKAKELLKRYNDGMCSAEEIEQVERWYIQEIDRSRAPEITNENLLNSKKAIWNKFLKNSSPKISYTRRYYKYAIAASVSVIFGMALYVNKKDTLSGIQIVESKNEIIKPGGNKATLTLADGTKVILGDVKNGFIANQNNATISKSEDGMLVYNTTDEVGGLASKVLFNTIDIPKGGQFKLLLPDGTKVWLNSMTSIKYPSNFLGSERRIELTGEAYFEVAKNKSMPFIVQTAKMNVEVLGTHFNVMSYANESSVNTTLLEGSVKVTERYYNNTTMLLPGYQASINSGKKEISVANANTEYAVAWKEGVFQFDKDDIKTIMKKLERWYEIEVVYEGEIPDDQFVGKISRNSNLNEVLKVLSLSKIKYRLQGKRIIISS